jgi:hypothetical protein
MSQPATGPVPALHRVQAVLRRAETGSLDGVDMPAVLAALELLRRLRDELTAWEPELITIARDLGASWAELAPALGVASRQAAERRYLRLRASEPGATADDRVQALRDRRAGDRAVNGWARENSASLRQLAGHVSSLDGIADGARQQIDLVQRALADDDSATLLQPLADAAPHLEPTHPTLAEQINRITETTDELRRQTQDRRARNTG